MRFLLCTVPELQLTETNKLCGLMSTGMHYALNSKTRSPIWCPGIKVQNLARQHLSKKQLFPSLFKIKQISHQVHLGDILVEVFRTLTCFFKISVPLIMNVRNAMLCQNTGQMDCCFISNNSKKKCCAKTCKTDRSLHSIPLRLPAPELSPSACQTMHPCSPFLMAVHIL